MKMHEATEKKEKFIELRGSLEMSLDKCADELQVSKPTLLKWEKEFADSISDLKRAKFSLLIDSLELGISSRLERLKELNEAITRELKGRKLRDVPTDKLIRLFLDSEIRLDAIIDKNNLNPSNSPDQTQSFEEYLHGLDIGRS